VIAYTRWLILAGAAASTLMVAGCGSASSPTTSIATASPSTVVTTTTTAATTTGVVPSGLGAYDGIACPSMNVCVAVGGATQQSEQLVESRTGQAAIAFSKDGGGSWSEGTLPTGLGPLNGVSCPAPDHCLAVGGVGSRATPAPGTSGGGFALFSKDGGATWASGTVPSGVGPLDAVSCPTVTQCVAVGPGRQVPVPGGSSQAASGGTGLFTTDGGATWAKISVASGVGAFYSVSCPTTSHCVTIASGQFGGDVGLLSSDGSSAWSSGTLLGDIEPDNDSDDKTSGRFSASLPSGLGTVIGISCASASNCVAFSAGPQGTQTVFSNDGGSKWSLGTVPDGAGYIAAVACPATSECVAFGSGSPGRGGALFSTDGGATWSPSSLPSGLSALYSAVSCSSASHCVTVAVRADGSDGTLLSVDGGASWS